MKIKKKYDNRAAMRRWRKLHPDYMRKYYENNPEKLEAHRAMCRKNNENYKKEKQETKV